MRYSTARRPAVPLLLALATAPALAALVHAALLGDTPKASAAAPGKPHPSRRITLPLLYDPPRVPYPLVRARVEGTPDTLLLLVDTGSDAPLLLTEWAAKKLKLERREGVPVRVNGIPFEMYSARSLALIGADGETARFNLDKLAAGDLDHITATFATERIAGVVGMPFLMASAAAEFDFSARTLTLYAETPPPPPGSLSFPMRPERDDYPDGKQTLLLRPLTARHADSKVGPLTPILDTGSGGELSMPYGSLFTDTASGIRVVAQAGSGGMMLDLITLSETLLVEGLVLAPSDEAGAGHRLGPVAVDLSPPVNGAEIERSLLGLGLLERFRVRVDGTRKRVYMTPDPSCPPRGRAGGDLGMQLIASAGEGYSVGKVLSDSPAERAGVRTGDRVVSIDGLHLVSGGPDGGPVSALAADSLTGGVIGSEASIVLAGTDAGNAADGETRNVKVKRVDRFAPSLHPPRQLSGMFAVRKNGSPLQVTALRSGSPAERLGLRVGDEVVAFDGKLLAPLSPGEFVAAFQRTRPDNLTVLRRGAPGTAPTMLTIALPAPPKK